MAGTLQFDLYSAWVRLAKILLVFAILSTLAGMLAFPVYTFVSRQMPLAVLLSGQALLDEPIPNPRISERIDDMQFDLKAKTAIPLDKRWRRVEIIDAEGLLQRDDGRAISITAQNAIYDSDTRVAELTGRVRFNAPDQGYELQTEAATIMADDKRVFGSSPVRILAEGMQATGEGFEVAQDEGKFLIKGRSELIIQTAATGQIGVPRNPSEASIQPSAQLALIEPTQQQDTQVPTAQVPTRQAPTPQAPTPKAPITILTTSDGIPLPIAKPTNRVAAVEPEDPQTPKALAAAQTAGQTTNGIPLPVRKPRQVAKIAEETVEQQPASPPPSSAPTRATSAASPVPPPLASQVAPPVAPQVAPQAVTTANLDAIPTAAPPRPRSSTSGPSLAGANLSGPSGTGPSLTGPKLPGPSLTSPSLTGPSLSGSQATRPNPTGPSLSGASLSGPTLSGSKLTGPTLAPSQQRPPQLSGPSLIPPNAIRQGEQPE